MMLRMSCTTVLLCYIVLLTQLRMTSSQTEDGSAKGACSELQTCDRCTSGDPQLNLTRCVWTICENNNNTRCIADTDDSGGCDVYNEKDSCQGNTDSEESDTDDTSRTDDDSPRTEDDSPRTGDDSPNTGGFSMSSFIGGIILVLVVQAGAFFAMRFLKTKDSSYETIEQT
ncbi:CD164 sialomucin-like 2 protein [Brachyhypopomus gauderio]|uniref:CD164 sialomucin-like 2 protein n=1 Tax=Brachyhypopomus gauderio TaxID=698409 RepID=UPI004042BAD8